MSDYNRLVSYIYSYPGGVRDKNVGFAKAEVRNGQLRLSVSLKGVYTDTPETFGVYFLVDKDINVEGKFTLLKMGNVIVNNGVGSYSDILNPKDINSTLYAYEDIKGLAVANKNNRYYMMFSMWEDSVVKPDAVQFASDGVKKRGVQTKSEVLSQPDLAEANPAEVVESSKLLEDPQEPEIADVSNDTQIVEAANVTDSQETELVIEAPPVELIQEALQEELAQEIQEDVEQTVSEVVNRVIEDSQIHSSEQEKEPQINSGQTVQAASPSVMNANTQQSQQRQNMQPGYRNQRQMRAEIQRQEMLRRQEQARLQEEARRQQIVRRREEAMLQEEERRKAEALREEEIRQQEELQRQEEISRQQVLREQLQAASMNPRKNKDGFESVFEKADFVDVFDDDYFYDCVEVTPEQLKKLPIDDEMIINNSFLVHGYYNYKHILFGKVCENDNNTKYFIAIPGMYGNRERFMASMYGFRNFKKSHRSDYNNPYFGYWYQEI